MIGQKTDLLNTKEKSRSLAFTSLAHFINDGGLFTIPLIFAILASGRIVSSSTIIVMPIVFYGASLLLSMYVANLADRTERPGLLVGIGLGLLSVGLFGFAASMSYASGALLSVTVLVSAFVAGLGAAFYHPIGAAILQSVYKDKTKGKALGINGGMGSFGRALYPSLFFAIASVITKNGSIALLAIVGLAASVIISFGLVKRRGSPTPSVSNDNRAPEISPQNNSLESRITMPLVILTLIAFVSAFATQGIAAWIPTYLALQKGLGITTSLGLALTGMYAASILGHVSWSFAFELMAVAAFISAAMIPLLRKPLKSSKMAKFGV